MILARRAKPDDSLRQVCWSPKSSCVDASLERPELKLQQSQPANMSALNKISPTSPSRQNPSELETTIASALYDLETNTSDLKAALRPLQIVSAREVSN